MYWEYEIYSFKKYRVKPGFPKSVASLGLPDVVKIHATLHERDEGRIYLFYSTASVYFAFDDNLNSLVSQNPIESRWPGTSSGGVLNAVFQWQGKLYHKWFIHLGPLV